jgi:hypothetical protein
MIDNLIKWVKANPAATFDAARDLLTDHRLKDDLRKVVKRAA